MCILYIYRSMRISIHNRYIVIHFSLSRPSALDVGELDHGGSFSSIRPGSIWGAAVEQSVDMFLSDCSPTNPWQHAAFDVTMTRRYDVHIHRHVYRIYVYIYTFYTCTDLHAHVYLVFICICVCFFILYIFGTSFVLYCGILERLS